MSHIDLICQSLNFDEAYAFWTAHLPSKRFVWYIGLFTNSFSDICFSKADFLNVHLSCSIQSVFVFRILLIRLVKILEREFGICIHQICHFSMII